jgi:hypothetical protein
VTIQNELGYVRARRIGIEKKITAKANGQESNLRKSNFMLLSAAPDQAPHQGGIKDFQHRTF